MHDPLPTIVCDIFSLIVQIISYTLSQTAKQGCCTSWNTLCKSCNWSIFLVRGWPIRMVKTSCWLRFGMFHHAAWAVGSCSSGPPAAGTVRTQSTGGFTVLTGHPVVSLAVTSPILRYLLWKVREPTFDDACDPVMEWLSLSAIMLSWKSRPFVLLSAHSGLGAPPADHRAIMPPSMTKSRNFHNTIIGTKLHSQLHVNIWNIDWRLLFVECKSNLALSVTPFMVYSCENRAIMTIPLPSSSLLTERERGGQTSCNPTLESRSPWSL